MPLLPHTSCPPISGTPPAPLHSAEPEFRRKAIRDLASLPGTAVLLGEQLFQEPDASVRHVLLGALATHPDWISEVILADCLSSIDASLRNGAIDALRFNSVRRLRVANSLLNNPDADVRLGALTLLEETDPVDVVDRIARQTQLLALLDSDPDVNVCAAILGLLETIADESSLDVIDRLRSRFSEEPYIQYASALLITRLDTRESR